MFVSVKSKINLEQPELEFTPSSLPTFSPNPERTLEWLGGVNYTNFNETVNAIKNLLSEDREGEIHLLINSFGGTSAIAMSFFDTMRSVLKPNLVTIGSGDVDSSGVILLLSGKRRFLTKNTTMLLHLAGRTFDAAKRFSTADMETMLKEDHLKDYQYACILADATGDKYGPDKIMDMMRRNTILTAEEAVNLGFAHRILG